MVYKREGGKFYHYKFEWRGERIRCSTKQACKETAKAMEATHRSRLAKGEVGIEDIKPAPRFAEFAWGRFWTTMQSEHSAKVKTVKYYRTSLRMLSRYAPLQNLRLDKVNADVIAALVVWCRKQKAHRKKTTLSIATINRTLEALRRLLKCAEEWDLIRKAPKVKKIDGEVGRDFTLTPEQEVAYLEAAAAESDELHAFAVSMLDGAWRPEDVSRFDWANVKFAATDDAAFGTIWVPGGKTKNSRRTVPMTRRLAALMEMRYAAQGGPKEGWVFPRATKSGHVESLLDEHNEAVRKSGVPRFVLYSLRHTALTRLAESGCDAFTLMKLAGHASVATSQKYVHPGDEHAQLAFRKFESHNAEQMKKVEDERKKEQVQ
jgi:integrase